MKIYNILKRLDEQKKRYENRGLFVEAAAVEETKGYLTNYINTQVVSKKEVTQAWDGGGDNISDFIEKIITLLSQVATLPKEEIEQTYNVQNLKTIYYLIHNSNLEMNRIIDAMKNSSIGELTKYNKAGTRSENSLNQNMDLYSELKNALFYENGAWVKPLADFYDNFESRSVKIESLVGDAKKIDNLYKIFESTELPLDLIKYLSAITGSQVPKRGCFETLFALLCKGGKFKLRAKNAYDAKGGKISDESTGDIIIANKSIELKANVGKGSGRIGGSKGFNNVEAIKKAYQTQMVSFAKFAFDNFAKQIPEDNEELNRQFDQLVGPYTNKKIELSLDLTTNSSVPTIDSVIQNICQAIVAVVGQPDAAVESAVMNEISKFYKSIWCNFTIDNTVINRTETLIDTYLAKRKINDIISEGRVFAEEDYYGFTQQASAALFAYYADLEKFDYIFVIDASDGLESAKMLCLSNDTVKSLISASPEDIMSLGLAFKSLSQTYGAPARRVRPSIDINF